MKKLLVCLAAVALVTIVSSSPAQARGRRGYSQVQVVSYVPAAYVAPVYAAPVYAAPAYVAPVYAAPVVTTSYVVPTVQTVYRVGRRGR